MKPTEEFLKEIFLERRKARGHWFPHLLPAQRLVLFFFLLVMLGTGLLLLPWAVPADRPLSWVDALFTATSAVCVTGLIVRDTATAFTPFGQVVIAFLIQAGGLGYMLLATSAAALAGRRIGVQERVTIKQALNLDTAEGLGRFVRNVLLVTFLIEAIGAVVLTLAYWPGRSLPRALALGSFHAVSGFNNAGFTLFSDNLMGRGGVPAAIWTIVALAIVGGLGFFVLNEFLGFFRRGDRPPRLSVHTKTVLWTTALLLVLGGLGLWAAGGGDWSHALFLSGAARTAGFNVENTAGLSQAARFLLIPLMFIGASPGGTGGGIKTTTLAVLMVSLWALLRGRKAPLVFRRRLGMETIYRAFIVTLTMGVLLFGGTLVMTLWEGLPLEAVLFEMTSALGTVGLSMGDGGNLSLCATFSLPGKLAVAASMFLGRLGPVTLALATASAVGKEYIIHPEGRVSIG